MPTEDEMTVSERRTYLKRMKRRYLAAKRKDRSALLTEMQQVTELHRKSLTRLMHASSLERKKRTSPRGRHYGPEVERVILRVWESRDYICAARLILANCSSNGLAKPIGGAISQDQPRDGGPYLTQVSLAEAAVTPERHRAGQ